ncbi:probable ATP-dependent RNA helicase DHX35 [Oppia nitens]|uniref:probable ATP-dependent RNA helicase DHX35 n=1 Tax=Oppia nitens TaxID=1686743 RepID=UPI0023DA9FC2|nr:probable ATP-dependent RNA helicase DHX35 [Oppia nitens]
MSISSIKRPLTEKDLLDDRNVEQLKSDEKIDIHFNPNKNLSIDDQRRALPVYKYRQHIEYLLEKYQTVVIVGETGCGKSTQLPQIIAKICSNWTTHSKAVGDGQQHQQKQLMVGVTEPRRVAAVSLATRVAEEMNTELGHKVGYSIGFENCADKSATRIKFMTEAILVNELMSDPLLSTYGAIIVDEAHERTLNTDILLALLKKIVRKRPDLRVIVSSATIEAEVMRDFFNTNKSTVDPSKDTSAILCLDGRCHPVDIFYSEQPVADYVKVSAQTVIKIHETSSFGDILVFLTGMDEVETCTEILKDYSRGLRDKKDTKFKKLYVLPMYASLPRSDQMRVFEMFPKSVRKVIVATNIAETSITISGIRFVIDSGFVKLRVYNPHTCTDSLMIVPTSQASAQQRAGRAGRERAGNAYRLYTEQAFTESLATYTVPEIQRSCLALTILQLKALGINNLAKFEFISSPPERHVVAALDLLYALGALNDSGGLTDPLGLRMAEFPLHPMFTKMLFASQQFGCSEEALTICAVLQVQSVFQQPPGGQRAIQARRSKHQLSVEEGDLITYLNVYNQFLKADKVKSWADRHFLNYRVLLRAVEVRHRLASLMNRFRIRLKSSSDVDSVRRAIVCGFFANSAYYHPTGVYRTIRGDHELHLHPTSVLYTMSRPPKHVVFHEVLHTSQQFMRDVTPIQPNWLTELAPHYYQCGTDREIQESRLLLGGGGVD